MPARKHRTGADLDDWLARNAEYKRQMLIARMMAKEFSGRSLLRLREAAAMLDVTVKTLRELELQGRPNWPQRVTISPKVTGYRLMDMEALIDSAMAAPPRVEEAA